MQTKVVHANGKCLNKIYEKKGKKLIKWNSIKNGKKQRQQTVKYEKLKRLMCFVLN